MKHLTAYLNEKKNSLSVHEAKLAIFKHLKIK